MQRYTREELLRVSGARSDELADMEARGLLLPNRSRIPFGRREPFYTTSQLTVLRYLLRSRRSRAATRRACPPRETIVEAVAPAETWPLCPYGEGAQHGRELKH